MAGRINRHPPKFKPKEGYSVVKCPPLFEWQKRVLNCYNKFRKNTFITVLSPRQCGKTFTIKILTLMESINRPGFKTIILTPTFAQAKKQFRELKKICSQIPGLVKSANASDFLIEFSNGSLVYYKSAESGDNLRGYTANLLIIDEAAYVEMDTAVGCCFPYVNTTNGNIVMFSTPSVKSDNNLFSKYYELGAKHDNIHFMAINWAKYDTSALLSPELKQIYFETLPTKIYRTEVLGEFIEEFSSVFGDYGKVLSNSYNINDLEYTFGIDWGSGSGEDDTAVVIFNSHKQMVKLRYWNDKNTLEGIAEIVKLVKEYRPKSIQVEINSLGKPNYDLLVAELNKAGIRIPVQKFTTTNDSKRKIIENLALSIQKQEIQMLNDPKLSLEFSTYELETTKTGKITYNASPGQHDDIVIATAIAYDALNKSVYRIR